MNPKPNPVNPNEPDHDKRPTPLTQAALTGLMVTVAVLLVIALIYVLVLRHLVLNG